MKRPKSGTTPGHVNEPRRFETDPSQEYQAKKYRKRFATNLTRSVFGRNYWDEEMTAELAADRMRKQRRNSKL